MATWLPFLVVLMLGTIHSAQIASVNQQINAAREPSVFVGFDDIVSRVVFKETAKKVYKREISDDFTIGDESNENASSDVSPLTADYDSSLKNGSSLETLTDKDKDLPFGNELDETTSTDPENTNTSPGELNATNGKSVEEAVSTEVATSDDFDAEDTEFISDGNIVVGEGEGANSEVLGKLMADEEGSGDDWSDSEKEENKSTETTVPESSNVSDQLATDASGISAKLDSEETKESEETSTDISIDPASEETVDPPDEVPIPDPQTEKEDPVTKDFQEDELIRVKPEVSTALVKSLSEESPTEDVEGSGEDPSSSGGQEETEPATEKTEAPYVPIGRNFVPIGGRNPNEQPETVAQDPDSGKDTVIMKTSTGLGEGKNDGINEIVKAEDTENPENASSTGSYIVLGAIMMTIVVLVAYTVVRSRRQKKSRRSGNITKGEDEDPGREMKEVDKLLAPRTNGFSAPNGGPRDDEKVPLKSFKGDFNEDSSLKNPVSVNNGGGLTDVIVENVPRLSTAPTTNGKAPNDSQSEDDQDPWVQGDGKALESTKIKMYIDEDSIPKTPIMIVNRGSKPNEV